MAPDPRTDDPRDEALRTDEAELPIQPTGSGVADLEIARMQDAVVDAVPEDDMPTGTQA